MIEYKYITSRQNQLVVYLCGLKEKKNRDREGVFRAEGKKLVREALKSGAAVKNIVAAERTIEEYETLELLGAAQIKGIPIICVGDNVYEKISGGIESDGVMCVAEKPAPGKIPRGVESKVPIVILDGVQDAGNAGTIVRTADALLENPTVILSEGCADLYGDKAVRASMGAVFRVKTLGAANLGEVIAEMKEEGYRVYAACLGEDSEPVDGVELWDGCAVILGSEGRGIRREISELADKRIIIPINSGSESLNVSAAAAILIWEMSRGIGR